MGKIKHLRRTYCITEEPKVMTVGVETHVHMQISAQVLCCFHSEVVIDVFCDWC